MDSVLFFLRHRSFVRGFRGHNTAWFVVGAALWMIMRARHGDDVVYRTKLKPGERLVIRTGPPDLSSNSGS